MATTEKLLTAEELARMPEPVDGVHYELFQGELVEMTPAGARHGACCARVCVLLAGYLGSARGGHVASNDTGLFTERDPDTVLAPDVAYWSKQRLPELPDGFVTVPPDLVVEVVSPSDTQTYLQRKVLHYLDHGVKLVWLVDPGTRTASVFRARDDVVILSADDEITGGDALPGFSCRVAEFFD